MMPSRAQRLMVIVPDRISDILAKGEYQPNYYNPGELFEEVHLVTTTDDRPDLAALQRTVGKARLVVEQLPDDPSIVARRWRSWFRNPLEGWARRGVDIARRVRPQLVRCHGADWNAFLASRIKRALGVPYLVSLHINPDVNPVRRIVAAHLTPEQARHNAFYEHIEHEGLRHADLVMPVYRSILPYLARHGITRVEVCYNVLNGRKLRQKASYARGVPFRIISVGRLIPEKNPEHLIRGLARLDGVELLVVGDGSCRHALEQLAAALGVERRVRFQPAIPNDELCEMLPRFDLFAVHTDYWELNKSVLEALLTGLPVVINRPRGDPVPELDGADFVRLVDNTTESYAAAIDDLMHDDAGREALGRRAYARARAQWGPEQAEAKVVEIYRRVMKS